MMSVAMGRLDQRGVAALTVVLIVVMSTGAAVATPVVVDAVDVDPDSPFYGLERLGERIRMVSDEDQMKERWNEYARVVARGRGLEYRSILNEFTEKMRRVTPENGEMKQEIVSWMQDQMQEMVRVRVRLMKDLSQRLRENMPELENLLAELEGLENLPATDNQVRENLRARLSLIAEQIREIAQKNENQLKGEILDYLELENLADNIDVEVDIRVRTLPAVVPMTGAEFENELEKFDASLAEVQAMLQGAPENALGRRAVERLIEVADSLRDRAVAAYGENRGRAALALIYSAQVHLDRAKMILEHASEWEPEFKAQWSKWKETWENMRQEWKEAWENMKQTWENMKQEWKESWENMKQTRESMKQEAWENMKQTWEHMKRGLKEAWENVQGRKETRENMQGLKEAWENMEQGLKETWKNFAPPAEHTAPGQPQPFPS
jgi:tetratricopeptide (TPR) repeat protein